MAWRVQRWGDPWNVGWMAWPAGMRQRLDTALNVYNLLDNAQGIQAGAAAKWATANPGAWDSLQNIINLVRDYDNDNPD